MSADDYQSGSFGCASFGCGTVFGILLVIGALAFFGVWKGDILLYYKGANDREMRDLFEQLRKPAPKVPPAQDMEVALPPQVENQ